MLTTTSSAATAPSACPCSASFAHEEKIDRTHGIAMRCALARSVAIQKSAGECTSFGVVAAARKASAPTAVAHRATASSFVPTSMGCSEAEWAVDRKQMSKMLGGASQIVSKIRVKCNGT